MTMVGADACASGDQQSTLMQRDIRDAPLLMMAPRAGVEGHPELAPEHLRSAADRWVRLDMRRSFAGATPCSMAWLVTAMLTTSS
jgi:hypothetical protein